VKSPFASDRPLELAGRGVQWLLNATIRRRHPVVGLPQELLSDRDFIGRTLGGRWKATVAAAAANTGFDYLALLFALRAVGADPRPSRPGWSGRSPWPASPAATRWPRRCCIGWPPTGSRSPPAARPTCCSATATTSGPRARD